MTNKHIRLICGAVSRFYRENLEKIIEDNLRREKEGVFYVLLHTMPAEKLAGGTKEKLRKFKTRT